MKNLIVAAALCAATAVAQAAPIQYDFSYDTGVGALSGSLMGELQADLNTLVISSFLDFAKFNGVAGPTLLFVMALSTGFGGPFVPASTTLDGSVQDFLAINGPGTEGFGIESASSSAALPTAT